MTMAKFASHHVGVFHFVDTVPIVYIFFKFSKETIVLLVNSSSISICGQPVK